MWWCDEQDLCGGVMNRTCVHVWWCDEQGMCGDVLCW